LRYPAAGGPRGPSGLSLVAPERPAVGSACEIEVELEPGTSIRAEGAVARLLVDGFAVRFTGIEFDSFERLRNLVRLNADHPERVDREFAAHLGLLRK